MARLWLGAVSAAEGLAACNSLPRGEGGSDPRAGTNLRSRRRGTTGCSIDRSPGHSGMSVRDRPGAEVHTMAHARGSGATAEHEMLMVGARGIAPPPTIFPSRCASPSFQSLVTWSEAHDATVVAPPRRTRHGPRGRRRSRGPRCRVGEGGRPPPGPVVGRAAAEDRARVRLQERRVVLVRSVPLEVGMSRRPCLMPDAGVAGAASRSRRSGPVSAATPSTHSPFSTTTMTLPRA
jgi:hypothetical protein